MLAYIFKTILIISLIGTVPTLLIAITKPMTRKYFSSGWHYYVWVFVLITMLIPFRIDEPIPTQQTTYTIYAPIQEFAHGEMTDTNAAENAESEGMFDSLKNFLESQMGNLAILWVLGMCFLFISKLIGYAVFVFKLRRKSEIISCPELRRFTDRKIVTRASDEISSPLMLGLVRPTLLLPKIAMTDEQLNNVLTHEMTHFKRKDILYKWFVCIMKCIHWFNPAIYYISRQINIECEISCDLAVVKGMTKEQEACYINTILTLLAAKNPKAATITTGMVSDKKTLKRRFTMIKNKVNISKKAMIISIVLILAVLGGTVFASGILNGKFVDEPEDEFIQVSNENPKLEEKEIVLQEISFNEGLENPVDGEISMAFGKREHPITKEVQEHNGIDIKAPEGTDVVSSITGTVTDVGFDADKGNYIVVERDNIKTVYSQLATANVKKGDSITARQSIGTVGKTGKSTGAHLHFEVMIDGEYCDPASLIK